MNMEHIHKIFIDIKIKSFPSFDRLELKQKNSLAVVVPAFNPSTWEAEAGGFL